MPVRSQRIPLADSDVRSPATPNSKKQEQEQEETETETEKVTEKETERVREKEGEQSHMDAWIHDECM